MFTIQDIRGVFPAMITPIREDGSVDTGAVAPLVEYFIQAGVSGLYVCGTTGETPLLTRERKEAMLGAVCEAVAGRLPVMVHVGTLPMEECLAFAKRAQELGARFLSAIPPYYFPFGSREMLNYYRALLDVMEEDCALFLYNIPAFARNSIPVEVVRALCEDRRFAGIKDSEGNIQLTQSYLEVLEAPRRVFIGSDDLIERAFTLGAAGSISGNANVLPELFVRLYRAKRNGRDDVVVRCQELVNQLAEATHYGNIPLLKAGLAWRGVPVGRALPPFDAAAQRADADHLTDTIAQIQAQLRQMPEFPA